VTASVPAVNPNPPAAVAALQRLPSRPAMR
jgi:hypothetical protein